MSVHSGDFVSGRLARRKRGGAREHQDAVVVGPEAGRIVGAWCMRDAVEGPGEGDGEGRVGEAS